MPLVLGIKLNLIHQFESLECIQKGLEIQAIQNKVQSYFLTMKKLGNDMLQKWIASLSLILFLFLIVFQSAFANDDCACHPFVNPHSQQYIIGYGSLIETTSKNATDPHSGINKPVWVDHYQRGWFSKGLSDGFSTTYLGVIKSKHARFNGTIFKYIFLW